MMLWRFSRAAELLPVYFLPSAIQSRDLGFAAKLLGFSLKVLCLLLSQSRAMSDTATKTETSLFVPEVSTTGKTPDPSRE